MIKKPAPDDTIPVVMPNEVYSKESRQSQARLIHEIYEDDPLVSPKYQNHTSFISPEAAGDVMADNS